MIDPRKLVRNLLKMAQSNAEGGYKARNSVSINPTNVKRAAPTVEDIWEIFPDRAKESYNKIILDPKKAYIDRGAGISSTTLEPPGGGYEVNKLRIAKGAMGNEKPMNNITFGMTDEEGELSYNRQNAKPKLHPEGTKKRFQQDYDIKLRRNELRAMLGRMLDDIRPGSMLNVSAWNTDKGGAARQKLYERETNRAMVFDEEGRGDSERLGRNTWRNSKGENRTFDPKKLKKPLKEMSQQFITRYMLRMAPFMKTMPVTNAIVTGADIGQLMIDTLDKNKSSSGRGGGRKALND